MKRLTIVAVITVAILATASHDAWAGQPNDSKHVIVPGVGVGNQSQAAAAASGSLEGLDAKIAQLSKGGTTLEEVVALLGEPEKYGWGDKTFKKNNLPESFIARYPKGLSVFISGGTVLELRAEGAGPSFTWQGKLRLGSSLEEVLQALGRPSKTMVGQAVDFAPNALYQDIDGQPGRAYYARPGQHVRCFFLNNKVTALYVTVERPEGDRMELKALPKYNPDSPKPFQVDLRGRDLSQLDLRASLEGLEHADFDETTVWPSPERMPAGFEWRKIMDLGKNPGLGVRRLHEEGITGRGVRVAIIDQPLLVGHQEYADRLRFYQEIGVPGRMGPQMHGAAVASIALGKTVGVAPGSDLYYVASWALDGVHLKAIARGVDRIVEVNRDLPQDDKIRVVSISKGWDPSDEGYEDITEAVQKAQDAGMLIVCTTRPDAKVGCDFHAVGRSPLADPDVFESYEPGLFWAKGFWNFSSSAPGMRFFVPMDSRTTAGPGGSHEYVFYRMGGLSWAAPYIAGLYALAVQVDPAITPERFWGLAGRTGRTIEVTRDGMTKRLGPIVDPARLIRAIQAGEKNIEPTTK
jgi:hypothetical protein